jgi:transcriptional antiterminator
MTDREFRECDEFKILTDRLMDRFDAIERKIDRLAKLRNSLNGDELLDNQDLCILLKTCKRTLQRYRTGGVLPFHHFEGKVYYKLSDIHEFIRRTFQPVKVCKPSKKKKS